MTWVAGGRKVMHYPEGSAMKSANPLLCKKPVKQISLDGSPLRSPEYTHRKTQLRVRKEKTLDYKPTVKCLIKNMCHQCHILFFRFLLVHVE